MTTTGAVVGVVTGVAVVAWCVAGSITIKHGLMIIMRAQHSVRCSIVQLGCRTMAHARRAVVIGESNPHWHCHQSQCQEQTDNLADKAFHHDTYSVFSWTCQVWLARLWRVRPLC